MFILKKEHQPGVYVPLRALFLVWFGTIEAEFHFRGIMRKLAFCIYEIKDAAQQRGDVQLISAFVIPRH